MSTIEEWQEVIQQILPQLKHPILLLKGNLGVGKTSFTQFLLRTLGSTDEVSSPTYAIVNEYTCPKGNIYHFDLYRMKSIDEAFDIGIEEYLETGFLSIIEWPEIYETELEGLHYHEMKIENIDGERHIVFK
ncbi:tRNA (adenosine(37)-N6)-threonylcarbamoyltransferase complex ATPase subunit type 1 TsaE [Riemerella anatipestifer]|nr:tRNA (adenosine(37)-N6)-threonylcarbamoyltransferase complex ATPase subunit type 1 TsaE [Riemerella anatipestifer]MCD5969452.1 tRNA (adenosine(37)-N6)-threonylcarbamoyltransferase complex ATPase subunit type 1 TsaE [Riemerella anatipestifer]